MLSIQLMPILSKPLLIRLVIMIMSRGPGLLVTMIQLIFNYLYSDIGTHHYILLHILFAVGIGLVWRARPSWDHRLQINLCQWDLWLNDLGGRAPD